MASLGTKFGRAAGAFSQGMIRQAEMVGRPMLANAMQIEAEARAVGQQLASEERAKTETMRQETRQDRLRKELFDRQDKLREKEWGREDTKELEQKNLEERRLAADRLYERKRDDRLLREARKDWKMQFEAEHEAALEIATAKATSVAAANKNKAQIEALKARADDLHELYVNRAEAYFASPEGEGLYQSWHDSKVLSEAAYKDYYRAVEIPIDDKHLNARFAAIYEATARTVLSKVINDNSRGREWADLVDGLASYGDQQIEEGARSADVDKQYRESIAIINKAITDLGVKYPPKELGLIRDLVIEGVQGVEVPEQDIPEPTIPTLGQWGVLRRMAKDITPEDVGTLEKAIDLEKANRPERPGRGVRTPQQDAVLRAQKRDPVYLLPFLEEQAERLEGAKQNVSPSQFQDHFQPKLDELYRLIELFNSWIKNPQSMLTPKKGMINQNAGGMLSPQAIAHWEPEAVEARNRMMS